MNNQQYERDVKNWKIQESKLKRATPGYIEGHQKATVNSCLKGLKGELEAKC